MLKSTGEASFAPHLSQTMNMTVSHHYTTAILLPFFGDHPGEPVPEENSSLLDFMAQGEINRGRHTDHLVGRHSIQTNQCPPPPSSHMTVSQCDLNQLHDLMNHYHVTPC